jgi:MoxR-like ATPase
MLDRFLFRADVNYVSTRAGLERLVDFDNAMPDEISVSVSVTPEQVDQAHAEAKCLPWSEEAKEAWFKIIAELAREGVIPGDRRKRKSNIAARAAAYLAGSDRVLPEHLEVLQHVLWDQPGDQAEKCRQVVGRIANPVGMRINALKAEADTVLAAYQSYDLNSAATTDAKLREIGKQLSPLAGNPKADRVLGWLRDEVRRIRRATVEAI